MNTITINIVNSSGRTMSYENFKCIIDKVCTTTDHIILDMDYLFIENKTVWKCIDYVKYKKLKVSISIYRIDIEGKFIDEMEKLDNIFVNYTSKSISYNIAKTISKNIKNGIPKLYLVYTIDTESNSELIVISNDMNVSLDLSMVTSVVIDVAKGLKCTDAFIRQSINEMQRRHISYKLTNYLVEKFDILFPMYNAHNENAFNSTMYVDIRGNTYPHKRDSISDIMCCTFNRDKWKCIEDAVG